MVKYFILLILVFFGFNISYSNVYYISPNGSDNNEGTLNKPFKTVDKAFNHLKPNTTLIFEDGEYYLSSKVNVEVRGTKGQTVNILAKNLGKVRFIIDEKINGENITFINSSFVNIEGINFVGNGFKVKSTHNILLAIRNSNNISVKSCSFQNSFEEGLKVSNSTFVFIYSNNFSNFYHEGIDFLNVRNSLIYKNNIHDVGRVGIMVKGGSENVLVVQNNIKNTSINMHTAAITIGGMTDSYSARSYKKGSYEAYNVYVINNIIEGNKQHIKTGIAFFGATESYALGNLITNTIFGLEIVKNNSVEYGWEENINNNNITISDNYLMNISDTKLKIVNPPNLSIISNKITNTNFKNKKIKFHNGIYKLNHLLINFENMIL